MMIMIIDQLGCKRGPGPGANLFNLLSAMRLSCILGRTKFNLTLEGRASCAQANRLPSCS